MTGPQLTALSPLIILAITSVFMMLVTAFARRHALIMGIGLIGLAAAGFAAVILAGGPPRQVTPLLIFDPFTAIFTVLIIAATAFVFLLSYTYMQKLGSNREEYYILLILAAFGASVLAAGTHFAALFLGFEILSVSLYALIAYPFLLRRRIEAGLKYLVLAALSSAFLLFGMALVYGGTGSMVFDQVAAAMQQASAGGQGILLPAGMAMVWVGLGFKLALVPFHWWTPDVYQGAPAPVTAFVATVSKGAIVAVLVRLFSPLTPDTSLFIIVTGIAMVSMIVGNLLALLQDNVKRILAYSSIAHLGYLMVAFLAGGKMAHTAVMFYVAAYFITNLGAFGVMTLLSTPETEAENLSAYRGLFWKRPWMAGILTLMLFSLGGIPLTAGFIGKVYILAAGIHTARWALVMVMILGSTIGLFYYLRIIVAMFATEGMASVSDGTACSLTGRLALVLLTGLLLWLGTMPAALIDLFQASLG